MPPLRQARGMTLALRSLRRPAVGIAAEVGAVELDFLDNVAGAISATGDGVTSF